MKKGKKSDLRYFNVPVQLLEGFLIDKTKVLENILDYAVYEKALSLPTYSELPNGKEALSYFKVNSLHLQTTLDVGKLLYEYYPKNSPKVGLNKDIWLSYYKTEKTEFEIITLLAFLALKSILGRKPYCKVTNNYWLARMDGKPCQIKSYDELSPVIKKYANEYRLGKIKQTLIDSWNLKTYSYHTRGFYVSFDKTLDDLIFKVEAIRKSNHVLDYKARVKEFRKEAVERLNGTRP